MEISRIKTLAELAGWERWKHQPDEKMISFTKGDKDKGTWVRVNVWYTTMTVGTCLTHPTQGKTQLFRRRVSEDLLIKILQTPRVHTRKGYKEKGWRTRL